MGAQVRDRVAGPPDILATVRALCSLACRVGLSGSTLSIVVQVPQLHHQLHHMVDLTSLPPSTLVHLQAAQSYAATGGS